MLWHGSILPRIHFALPCEHLLEIAPGFGRVTGFLLERCGRYTGVDIAPNCVAACRERFASAAHARFEVNDGRSLECVPDGSVDFAFSWDSLVHADPEVLAAYVQALARKLRPGGQAFLHHSNLGAFRDPVSGKPRVENRHWRDERVSAETLRALCARTGLALDGQELVQWGTGDPVDCFSWLHRPREGEVPRAAEAPLLHPDFRAEVGHMLWLARVQERANPR
jgi:SAM-dependent methyltransferase